MLLTGYSRGRRRHRFPCVILVAKILITTAKQVIFIGFFSSFNALLLIIACLGIKPTSLKRNKIHD